jgi:uncharacterized protein (TIGR02246 family)
MRAIYCISTVSLLIVATRFDVSAELGAGKGASFNSSSIASAGESDRSQGKGAKEVKDAPITDSADAPDPHAADRMGLLETAAAFVKAYAAKDAAAIAAQFALEGEYQDESGQIFQGRKNIEDTLKEFFEEHPKASLELDIDSIRFLSADLAIEDGSTTCTLALGQSAHHSPYVAIHTKLDGKWLLASVREDASRKPLSHAGQLRQLEWLVGDWIDQDDDSVVHFNCQLTEDGSFLVRDFTVTVAGEKVIGGTQRTGWDPVSGRLRSWTFDSAGGHFDGAWHRNGESWLLMSSGITSEGQAASGTSIFTPVNSHTMTWQMVDLSLDGARIADSEEYTLVRLAPKPETEEADK